jgi:hypothetical protein
MGALPATELELGKPSKLAGASTAPLTFIGLGSLALRPAVHNRGCLTKGVDPGSSPGRRR